MDWRARIANDPAVCGGVACIRGTRIPVAVLLDNLADGLSDEQIAAGYPPVSIDDVRAAVAYAAELARERIVDLDQAVPWSVQGEAETPRPTMRGSASQ